MVESTQRLEAVVYCRTDNSLSGLEVQLTDCIDESSHRLGAGDVPADAIEQIIEILAHNNGRWETPGGESVVLVDTRDRSGNFKRAAEILQSVKVEHLVLPATASPEVEALIETALDAGIKCHLVPGPWTDSTAGMSDVMIRRAGPGEEWSGRPPTGFEVRDGHLVSASDFEEIVATLRLVKRGKLSKRAAADELSVSRRTITRCLESPNRYLLTD